MDILLDGQAPGNVPLYAPGDVISGIVIYDIPAERPRLDAAFVVFDGWPLALGQVTAQRLPGQSLEEYLREDGVIGPRIFSLQQRLFKGPVSAPSQRRQWRFGFQIPEQWLSAGVECPIPPSLSCNLRNSSLSDDHVSVSVIYRLRAIFESGGRLVEKEVQPLVRPVSQNFPPRVQDQALAFTYLQQPRHFPRLVVLLSHNGSIPAAQPSLKINLAMPDTLYRGQRGCVYLSLAYDIAAWSAGPVGLSEVVFALKSRFSRGSSDLCATHWHGQVIVKPRVQLSHSDPPLLLWDNFGLDSFFSNARYLPDFKSPYPSLEHMHFFEVTMKVQLGRDKSHIEDIVELKGMTRIYVPPREA